MLLSRLAQKEVAMRLLGKDEIKPEEPMGKERQMFVVFASILLLCCRYTGRWDRFE
jgi:hypothetical protein